MLCRDLSYFAVSKSENFLQLTLTLILLQHHINDDINIVLTFTLEHIVKVLQNTYAWRRQVCDKKLNILYILVKDMDGT
jgi:hypothetical protein